MKRLLQLGLAAFTATLFSQAHASPYYANNAPAFGSGEINASAGGLNARSLVAAGRMALKFWKNTATTEAGLLSLCQSKSPAGTTWKEGCNFGGMTAAMTATYGGWTTGVFTDQTMGINSIISGMTNYHSPVIVPLYGHATHWGTIYMIDASGSTLNGVEWYDSGPAGVSDGQFTYYADGVQGADGASFANVFYKVLNSSYLSASDPYLGRYLSSFDPPRGVSEEQEAELVRQMPAVLLNRSPGILKDGEIMSVELAQERVWDALFAASVHESPNLWPSIEKGFADPAMEVHGATPDGSPWNYYLVPIRSEFGETLGLVQLSADDGAYQQMWAGFQAIEYFSLSAQEAQAIAERHLTEGDQLLGGDLTWSPSIEDRLVGSPLFPYYEFFVFAKNGTYKDRLLVTLQAGTVILPDAALESVEKAPATGR